MNPVWGITLKGMEALRVEVEAEITGGLFAISIVGLPDTAVRESKERVRAALRSLGLSVRGRVAVNLAPADLPKEGAILDLPIALGIAGAMGSIPEVPRAIFLGELALDGRLRGVRGAVGAAILARDTGIPLFVPADNADEVSLVEGCEAWGAESLGDVIAFLRGEKKLIPVVPAVPEAKPPIADPDFADIRGQSGAKRALEIAAAGHHNILFTGAPGSGKTLLARALRGILPPLSRDEFLEAALVRSTLGIPFDRGMHPPFRTVHHTASIVSICGGGATLRPGEVSLAHRGVLFLDEFPEFRRDLLEALRQLLEDGRITVSRASGSVVYPCRVLLVAACNPCPCGWQKGDFVFKLCREKLGLCNGRQNLKWLFQLGQSVLEVRLEENHHDPSIPPEVLPAQREQPQTLLFVQSGVSMPSPRKKAVLGHSGRSSSFQRPDPSG